MIFTSELKTKSRTRPESRRALVVAVALHIVLGAALVRVLMIPLHGRPWFSFDRGARPVVEKLTFVQTPAGAPQAPRVGPVKRSPVTPPPIVAPSPPTVVAPSAVPNQLPPAPTKPRVAAETPGVGPVTATGGPASGARPEYYGPRVWVPAAPPDAGPPPTLADRLDATTHAMFDRMNDSLAQLGTPRKPGDWTGKIGGNKYGVDQQYIYLGPIKIPTAILAILPVNTVTGNPTAAANERLLSLRAADIQYQAQRQMDEDQFHKAVKEVRQREERKHEQQLKDRKSAPPPPSPPPTNPPVAVQAAPVATATPQ